MHTAAGLQDANSRIPDETSAFFRTTPSAGTDVHSTPELYTYILYSWVYEMNSPDCWNPDLSHGFMLNVKFGNYVITDFVDNYVCIIFFTWV